MLFWAYDEIAPLTHTNLALVYEFSANGALSSQPGATPKAFGAESAIQFGTAIVNPRHNARRNQRLSAQQPAVFLLKRASAVVLLLRVNVSQYGLELTRAHGKGAIPA